MGQFSDLSSALSNAVFLAFLAGIPVYGFFKGVKVYEAFVEGAKEGFEVAVRIIPYLVAILVVVGMLRASGAVELVARAMPDAVSSWAICPEIVTMAMIRPLSGSASLGILGEVITRYGADSHQARLGGVIMGSTETTLYVLAVYFGAVGVTRTRYALHAGLLADAAGIVASVAVCWLIFR